MTSIVTTDGHSFFGFNDPGRQLSQLAWSATMWHSRSGTVLNPLSSCD